MYTFSINNRQFKSKPNEKEVRWITKNFSRGTMDYRELASKVGENGCTFCPAVYKDNYRKNDNFIEQQLVVLDFDEGITFDEAKRFCEENHLPILFAYKTFSWQPDHEKFRLIFAMDEPLTDRFEAGMIMRVLMFIFGDSDKSCKDAARLFYGGKGLLYLSEKDIQMSKFDLMAVFESCLKQRYHKHSAEKRREFFEINGAEFSDGKFIKTEKKSKFRKSYSKVKITDEPPKKKKLIRKFNWDALYKCCRLYREFVDLTVWFYYPEVYMILLNLIQISGGEKKFFQALDAGVEKGYFSYDHDRWAAFVNAARLYDYQPEGCNKCPYEQECRHGTNMIVTAKPPISAITCIEEKEYFSIEEAVESLRENFEKALKSRSGIHIIKAQTGIGKTQMYIDYILSNPKKPLLIAVPNHKLKDEIYAKIRECGVSNVIATPRLLGIDNNIIERVDHTYEVGAGKLSIEELTKILEEMPKGDANYEPLKEYIENVKLAFFYNGHVITTHDRFLYLSRYGEIFKTHYVIIDEDILQNVYQMTGVDIEDLKLAVNMGIFNETQLEKINAVIEKTGYHDYTSNNLPFMSIDFEILDKLQNISTNVIGVVGSPVLYNNGTIITYINYKPIPCDKMIVLSATVDPELYQIMLPRNVIVKEYICKQAKYMGKLVQYTNSSYSRYAIDNSIKGDGELIDFVKKEIGDDEVITFKAYEGDFNTDHHFGNTIGINALEGKNISVVGLPNLVDVIYTLYGMIAGVKPQKAMRGRYVEYNGYRFYMQTFKNDILQKIHMWIIESNLEQAIGRARLLRHDCTVKVFARFPIEQAEIVCTDMKFEADEDEDSLSNKG